jgi:hypothetical protein
MGAIAVMMGMGIGWLSSIGRSSRTAQAAAILSESAFRCQNASAGGKRATLEIRRRRDHEGTERVTAFVSAQRHVLTANFEPAPPDHPELDWFVNAAGGPDWAKPQGDVKLVDDGRTAAQVGRGGWVDFGTRPGFAVTDGVEVEAWVNPAPGASTMTFLKSTSGIQNLWLLRFTKDPSGPDVYRVVLQAWLLPEDAAPATSAPAQGDLFQTEQPCLAAGRWSHLEVSFDGRDASIRVDGVERLPPAKAPARPGPATTPGAAVETLGRRFPSTPEGVARLTLSTPELPYTGRVDTLSVSGVFRSNEDEQVLSDVDVLRPALPLRVVYANGRLDPVRHGGDVVVLLTSLATEQADTALEVRLGLYGDIAPPKRVLLSPQTAPGTTSPPTTPSEGPR